MSPNDRDSTGVYLKDAQEVSIMRRAGAIVRRVLEEASGQIRPGVTLLELERWCHRSILEQGGMPSFLGYQGFPAAVCISVNDEVVHGIPSERRIADADLVKLDVGVTLDGMIADAAATYVVGAIPARSRELVVTTEQALYKGIEQARAGNHLHDISHAIQTHVERQGFSVVRALSGHGVGRKLHEGPSIPNFGRAGSGVKLRAGMTLAIEPMINLGNLEVCTEDNGWTVKTRDGRPSAHFEHTILVTDGPAEILTQ